MDASDPFALASRAGRAPLDVSASSSRTPTHRPQRSLDQRTPLAKPPINEPAPGAELPQLDLLRRRDRLGGLLREYRIAAELAAPRIRTSSRHPHALPWL